LKFDGQNQTEAIVGCSKIDLFKLKRCKYFGKEGLILPGLYFQEITILVALNPVE
jgi:hypothetical protein